VTSALSRSTGENQIRLVARNNREAQGKGALPLFSLCPSNFRGPKRRPMAKILNIKSYYDIFACSGGKSAFLASAIDDGLSG
jgi:hypothetical protein